MVDYEPSLLKDLQAQKELRLAYTSQPHWGQYFGIRHDGILIEIGARLNPSFMMLGWFAQSLEYKAELAANLSRPALVVPIMKTVGEQRTVSVQLPSATLLKSFSSMTLDARLTCVGSNDLDCDMWDHILSVVVDCGSNAVPLTETDLSGSPNELGRSVHRVPKHATRGFFYTLRSYQLRSLALFSSI